MIEPPTAIQDRPFFSVVIAVWNGAGTLQRALDSILEQTYGPIEVIVIDGASTDGTQAILERNADRIAYWESKPDRGIYHAWNKALDHVSGEWICFLGADDRYHAPDVLEQAARLLKDDAGRHRVAYGTIDIVRDDGSFHHAMGAPWDDVRREQFRQGGMIPHPATFHHRSLFGEHGRFDERFRIAGDYEFLLRVLLDHDPLFIPVLIVDMAIGGLSDRPSSKYTRTLEVHRARYMHGLVSSPPWRSMRLIRQITALWFLRNVRRRARRLRSVVMRRLVPRG